MTVSYESNGRELRERDFHDLWLRCEWRVLSYCIPFKVFIIFCEVRSNLETALEDLDTQNNVDLKGCEIKNWKVRTILS